MTCCKKELRARYRSLRNSMSDTLQTAENEKIYELLINSQVYKDAQTIFIYVSVGSEVSTDKIIRKALSDGKRVAVPLCDTQSRTMSAVVIDDMSQLVCGAYGIPEPQTDNKPLEKNCIDLAIVPALAFDRRRMRLGYGGGYYDKFLKDFCGYSVGLAFSCCVTESLPCEEFDIPVCRVISTSEMI